MKILPGLARLAYIANFLCKFSLFYLHCHGFGLNYRGKFTSLAGGKGKQLKRPNTGVGFRGGRYIRQPAGYSAFIPSPLPPTPPLRLENELQLLLSKADRALARLDGVGSILPDPERFISAYGLKEALLSSQIEGTQASLTDVLEAEVVEPTRERRMDVMEVVNYTRALRYGLERVKTLPLSLRLICEIHGLLLEGVRGSGSGRGEFRRSQNWIGPEGCTLAEAAYVPPPVHEMKEALHDFEGYIRENQSDPPLIRCALAHAQFETIHPFIDGNGRMGRLLIAFMLCQQNVLERPLLYLSYYFKRKRDEYYRMLMVTREQGDWEGWVRFFLDGVVETAEQAAMTARAIVRMRQDHEKMLSLPRLKSKHSLPLLQFLFERPIVTAPLVANMLKVSHQTAIELCRRFAESGLLRELPGRKRNRSFVYQPYLEILREGTDPIRSARPSQA
ncbi:MAG: Fic family protein [Candidatus Tectomicrobia bacterium]|uniref:Fic family protein n=1 Tax=Tectimicrobiota bacterium TaxID=2528274 RepID=A0A932HYS9_UNCTE|nr:Fic family protein [Candidatus Tectomicrobia bacterium]